MSSTETERDELLRKFYEDHLLPAAESLRCRGVSFFPLSPDRENPPATYYETRRDSKSATYVVDLENMPQASWLCVRWAEHPELLQLIEPLVELAFAVEQGEEDAGNVSPFIYAMF